ncbi:uncharacterized protein [Miscanthus floridulus]|uniref:uncharacterized protein n=1 Tax=Miscanthus floridulus TaxID=154761 RepID=UPI00345906AB
MHYYFVAQPRAVGPHTPNKEHAFKHVDTTFKATILSMLEDSIVDAYVPLQTGKEIWDALEAKYGVSDAGSELYAIEQFHDYRMVNDHSVVEQAHEIQTLAKELKIFGCVLPNKFVAKKARAKDVHGKKTIEGGSSAHVVRKNLQHSHKKKFQQELKQKNTMPFKKKKKGNCFTRGKSRHYAKDYPDGKWKPQKKSTNMIEADGGISGYG